MSKCEAGIRILSSVQIILYVHNVTKPGNDTYTEEWQTFNMREEHNVY